MDERAAWGATMPSGTAGKRRVNRAGRETRHVPGGLHFLANAPAQAWSDLPADEPLVDMGAFLANDLQPGDEIHLLYPLLAGDLLRVKVRSQHDRVNPWAPKAWLTSDDYLAELPFGSQLLHRRSEPLIHGGR